jgi:hypothetical protein
MPWLVGGEFLTPDFCYVPGMPYDREIDVPLGKVYVSDAEVLSKSPTLQFGNLPDRGQSLLRAEFEVGRVFWHLNGPRKSLPSSIDVGICDRLKRIIEELEPDKHRFIPRDLRQPDKVTPWPEPYWYWHNDNYVDAIVPDIGDGDPQRSKGIFWNSAKGYLCDKHGRLMNPSSPTSQEWPVLSRSAIENVHAWKENGFALRNSNGLRFHSDTLVVRMREQGLHKGWGYGELQVSDLPATRNRVTDGD